MLFNIILATNDEVESLPSETGKKAVRTRGGA